MLDQNIGFKSSTKFIFFKNNCTYGLDNRSCIEGRPVLTAEVLNIEWRIGCITGGQSSGRLPTCASSNEFPKVISYRKWPKQ